MAQPIKSLIESLLGKMTDEEGLFRGGEQGQVFGRIRDLFRGGGAHENIDGEIALEDLLSLPKRKSQPLPRAGHGPETYVDDLREGIRTNIRNRGYDPDLSSYETPSLGEYWEQEHGADRGNDIMNSILGVTEPLTSGWINEQKKGVPRDVTDLISVLYRAMGSDRDKNRHLWEIPGKVVRYDTSGLRELFGPAEEGRGK